MTKQEMTETILAAKQARGVTWTALAAAVGLSEVYTTSACLGENVLSLEEAQKVSALLGLGSAVTEALTQSAAKGEAALSVPRDPVVYRLQEIIYVYGRTIKELIEEKCGLGIMSAIDLTMSVEKRPDPKGDRVVITMDGKFLPYRKW
jgi:cyanate lyase